MMLCFCGFRGDNFPQSKLLPYCGRTERWTTPANLWHSDRNLEFCLEGKGYPIGLLLAEVQRRRSIIIMPSRAFNSEDNIGILGK